MQIVIDPLRILSAVGRHAGVVRRCVPGERQVWRHHVGIVGHRDSKGDRDQQPPASTEASPRHSRDDESDKSVGACHFENGKCVVFCCFCGAVKVDLGEWPLSKY